MLLIVSQTMAKHQNKQECPVQLGFVDEEITSKYVAGVNCRVSKIGGVADWPVGADCLRAPFCRGCTRSQVRREYYPRYCQEEAPLLTNKNINL